MGRNPNSLKNLEKGNRLRANDEQTRAIAVKGGKARQRQRSAQAIFRQILSSVPQLDNEMLDTLASLGITSTDDVLVQTAIGAAIAQKGMKGDVKAAQFAFDMAGELMATKVQLERVKLERERLELEKQRLELERQGLAQNEVTIGVIDPFITALAQFGASQGITTDIPEGIIDNSGVSDEEAAE